MSDKYPSISPYAYCAWNPIKRVDPDGRDDYETDRMGHISRCKNQTNAIEGKDRLFASGLASYAFSHFIITSMR